MKGQLPKNKNLSTHFGNGVVTVMSVWDHDIGGLFESESGVALLDLELELKLWNNGQHISHEINQFEC